MEVIVNNQKTPFGEDFKSLTSSLLLLQSSEFTYMPDEGIKAGLGEIINLLREGFQKEMEELSEKREKLNPISEKFQRKELSSKIRKLSNLRAKLGQASIVLKQKLMDERELIQFVYNLCLSVEGLGVNKR